MRARKGVRHRLLLSAHQGEPVQGRVPAAQAGPHAELRADIALQVAGGEPICDGVLAARDGAGEQVLHVPCPRARLSVALPLHGHGLQPVLQHAGGSRRVVRHCDIAGSAFKVRIARHHGRRPFFRGSDIFAERLPVLLEGCQEGGPSEDAAGNSRHQADAEEVDEGLASEPKGPLQTAQLAPIRSQIVSECHLRLHGSWILWPNAVR
mmetsp:Transcript_14433/g.36415  ORF Transcript_14433/g.36415 Transcript_14433/m.36415 type:complete len:208 (+) Transcript_14433:357-980(+)